MLANGENKWPVYDHAERPRFAPPPWRRTQQHRASRRGGFGAQKLLGHSNLSTTADVYTHTSADAERDAALSVERAIYGDLFVNVRENANNNERAAVN